MAVTGAIGAVTREALPGGVTKVTIPWTSDAAAGTVTEVAVELPAGTLIQMKTDPGATAPTDNYDVTLLESVGGSDLLFGAGADRDTSNTEIVGIVYTNTARHPYLEGGDYYPTIAAAGNSKVGTIVLYIAAGMLGL